ncbi:MAG: EF hand [Marteilia pararefringens]
MDRVNRRKIAKEQRAHGKGKTSQIYNSYEPAEVQMRKDIFNVMKHDANKDGLTANDIKLSYGDIGIMASNETVSKMMDGLEEISFPIFLNKLTGDAVSTPASQITSALQNFDMDGSNALDAEIMHKILCSTEFEDPLPEEVYLQLLQDVPKDNTDRYNIEALTNIIKVGTCEGINSNED